MNNAYREQIADAGLWFSGTSPDRHLVEFVELPRDQHPFYVGTQAHPELRSRPNDAHPLFRGLVEQPSTASRPAVCSRMPESLSGSENGSSAGIADDPFHPEVTATGAAFSGMVWDVRRDTFDYNGHQITREYVDHTGAVGVLAIDDEDRVLLIRQYRHPVRQREWEIPAGLLDVEDEDPLVGAQRELAEEVDLAATQWAVLSDYQSSPGGSTEAIRVYLARGLSVVSHDFEREAEEADMEQRWVALTIRRSRAGAARAELAPRRRRPHRARRSGQELVDPGGRGRTVASPAAEGLFV